MSDGLTARLKRGRLADAARRRAPAFISAAASRARLVVLERGPTSLVPELPPPDDPLWTQPSEMPGVAIDLDAQIAFMQQELASYAAEFPWAVRGNGYQMWNGLYQAGDAEILYALVRYLKPGRILEIGSGWSTLISASACRANTAEGAQATDFVSVDPEPRLPLDDDLAGLTRLERTKCQDIPLERFLELGDGDILFIDTTHVVKLGGEVNWLVLEVLPRLRPGVIVQIHDVHLPYEYPRLVLEYGDHMNEQYLVHALLIGNPDWEILLALSALARARNEAFFEVVPSIREPIADLPHLPTWLPAAFWLRRTGGTPLPRRSSGGGRLHGPW